MFDIKEDDAATQPDQGPEYKEKGKRKLFEGRHIQIHVYTGSCTFVSTVNVVNGAAYTIWRLMSLRGLKEDGTILWFREPTVYYT